MTRLRKFLNLPGHDRRLLVKALVTFVFIRIGIKLLSLKTLQTVLDRTASHLSVKPGPREKMEQIAWALETTLRVFPMTNHCLTRALVAQVLLKRDGFFPRLRIGVAKNKTKGFIAHAWVECGGRVITGPPGPDQFTSFPDLDRFRQ